MHIAIDSTPLASGHSDRGVGIYTKNLIESLKRYEKDHSYTLFTHGQEIPTSVDVVHYPYFDPFFLTLPIIKKKPTVVTVHDVIPLVFPERFPAGVRGTLKWQIQKLSLRGASRIIADSDTSKHDISRFTGFPKEAIDRIYLAPSVGYQGVVNKKHLEYIQKKFTLPDRFILYVGDVNWNKNVLSLLKAFSLALKHTPNLMLVLVGKSFINTHLPESRHINQIIAQLKIESHIIKTGFVSDEELSHLYALATCLIQPSYYEGFGLPVLEAMTCGCPVIASHSSSLSEIKGPSLSINPDDPENIASSIIGLLEMPSHKKKDLVKEGYAWAEKFTWQKTAEETIKTYKKALA
jgi:glycosyltransferase involved in cell wall biosynthesis